ncbi:hydrogenase-4 component E [Hydrogenispora ethanolica]|jgi:hydrogenase-4 component E|uniref:Hydrogenase-4 component E n=1 Tax=Hydrogenispora ethanolica TaxID=1082276 RepID=A0A4R1R8B9_HYDET|nr:hypothetical protein [Hydrogenispora ethanolica]TCL61848.1 hydrogenase-4 component E [Hydrogenispora ethanolica]
MFENSLHNLSHVAIPGWDLGLVAAALTTVLICLAKKYRNMTLLLIIQACCLSALTFFLGLASGEAHLLLAGLANLAFKGAVIPYLLWASLRKAGLDRRKDERFSVLAAGVWIGAIALLTVFLTPPLLAAAPVLSGRTLQCGLAGIFLGLWMMIFRNFLYSQVAGLLLMENGLYLVALALTSGMPVLIELGIMFDLFVAVVVVGILLERVRRLFETTAIDQLKQLRG